MAKIITLVYLEQYKRLKSTLNLLEADIRTLHEARQNRIEDQVFNSFQYVMDAFNKLDASKPKNLDAEHMRRRKQFMADAPPEIREIIETKERDTKTIFMPGAGYVSLDDIV